MNLQHTYTHTRWCIKHDYTIFILHDCVSYVIYRGIIKQFGCWTEESDPLQSIGLWIVAHYWSNLACQPGLVVFFPLTISVKNLLFHKIDDIIWSNAVQLTLSEQRKFKQAHLILFLPFFMTACNQGVALARSLTMSDVGGDSSEPAFLKKAAQRFV